MLLFHACLENERALLPEMWTHVFWLFTWQPTARIHPGRLFSSGNIFLLHRLKYTEPRKGIAPLVASWMRLPLWCTEWQQPSVRIFFKTFWNLPKTWRKVETFEEGRQFKCLLRHIQHFAPPLHSHGVLQIHTVMLKFSLKLMICASCTVDPPMWITSSESLRSYWLQSTQLLS